MPPANDDDEEVKEPETTDESGGGDKKDKKGVKLVHKVYEDEDKNFVVYGLCCNIL